MVERALRLQVHQSRIDQVRSILKAPPEEEAAQEVGKLIKMCKDLSYLQDEIVKEMVEQGSQRVIDSWNTMKPHGGGEAMQHVWVEWQALLAEANVAFPLKPDFSNMQLELAKKLQEQDGSEKIKKMLLAWAEVGGGCKQELPALQATLSSCLEAVMAARGLHLPPAAFGKWKTDISFLLTKAEEFLESNLQIFQECMGLLEASAAWFEADMVKTIKKMSAAMDLKSSFENFSRGNDELQNSMTADPGNAKLASLVRSRKAMGAYGDVPWGHGLCQAMMNKATELEEKALKVLMENATTKLHDKEKRLGELAGGMEQAAVWRTSIKDEDDWQEVLQVAKQTLLKLDRHLMERLESELQEACRKKKKTKTTVELPT